MTERVITKATIEQFEAYLHKEERSNGTVDNYIRNVRELAAWLAGQAVTKEQLVAWKDALQAKRLQPTTVNAKLAAIGCFLRVMGWQDCQVRFLRVQRRVFREKEKELTREEYEKLLAAAQQQGSARLALLLETICATGVRVSEVQYITVEAARRGRADVTMKGKIRTILIPNKLCRKLLKYAKQTKTASGKIFFTRNGTALSRKQIWAEMKSLCQAAGVSPGKVFPHNLRHLFATVFYRACHDIVKLADVLGHSRIETTRIYLVTTGFEYAKQLEQLGLVS
ncbi:MAG: tyrosine-type recombinase/integrase [Blautia massiliensis (ex Durand et al. 2017)]